MIYHKFEVRIDWYYQYYNTYNIEESISGNKNRFYIYWEPKNNIFDNLKSIWRAIDCLLLKNTQF